MRVIWLSIDGVSNVAKEGYERIEIPDSNKELEEKVANLELRLSVIESKLVIKNGG